MAKDFFNKRGTYHQIRDQWFYIEVILYNEIDKPLYVPFVFVDSLKIHETLFTWNTKGEITFSTDFEVFSRGALASSGSPGMTADIKPPYIDRTDGRNRVHITIQTVDVNLVNGQTILDPNSEQKFPKKYWELDMDFVVIDIEDVYVDNAQRKKRKYILVDEHYQILKEKNLEWSSALFQSKKKNIDALQIKDSQAAMNPNEVLKDFLTLVSTNGDTMSKINVGFDSTGSIQSPNIPFDKIIEKDWDKGDPKNLVLFYPTANSDGVDDVNYILSHCSSSDQYPVILSYGRSSEDKGWQLNSLSTYFKNSKKEQVERLIIEDGLESYIDKSGNTKKNTPYVSRADGTGASQSNNFTSLVASRITSYKFSPMVSVDDSRILNSPLVYFDEHTGKFVFKKKTNNVKTVLEKLKALGKMGLYNFTNTNGQILLNLNKTKTSGQMHINKHALNGPYSCQTSPMNQMILDAIFLNQSVAFTAPGLTLRAPGKFIFLDRVGAGEKNAFDDRFLGQWLINNVTHYFDQGNYKTEVVANKLDAFSTIFPAIENY